MAFFFNRKKPELKEEMRMRLSAPSFSFKEGTLLSLWTLNELKEKKTQIRGNIVILYPGVNAFLYFHDWMKILSGASYLVICTSLKECGEKMKKEAEKTVYSIGTKTLSGVSLCTNIDEARLVVSSITNETKRDVVTINNTEGEISC